MDYFEIIVSTLLESEGYWVRRSFKVNLTKQEKSSIGKPSIPRPEIDLLGLNFQKNEILVLEAKSFLDSPGVMLSQLQAKHDTPEGRYKLFTSEKYRNIVTKRLHEDLKIKNMANNDTRFILGLVAGKVYQNEEQEMRNYMDENNWFFWSPKDIRERVINLTKLGYENDPAIITAKILVKGDT